MGRGEELVQVGRARVFPADLAASRTEGRTVSVVRFIRLFEKLLSGHTADVPPGDLKAHPQHKHSS